MISPLNKRKLTTNNETEKKPAPRNKKSRATETKEEPQYVEEKRNLEDLWKVAFPWELSGTNLMHFHQFNWDFKNLEQTLEEGLLLGKKFFVFASAEPQLVSYKDTKKIRDIPTVIAIESVLPPSDKIATVSIQSAMEEIFPMKQMKMDWIPYIPIEKRDRQVDRMYFQIFILGCKQRRSALRQLKEERARMFEYCIPYFYQPIEENELEESTVVYMIFPTEPPLPCEFDWELDELEEFVDDQIENEKLCAEQKDEFKEFVKEQVRAAKKANREAKDARKKAKELDVDTQRAFQSMRFYKFYPQPSPDVPTFQKSPFINRFYGKTHKVL
ncbi:PREDICTED: uncharacterized protein LOC104704182 [Camelina sativa]|uniref:Uncharacterized protein LOC104704182 n=1 Tax=Camelina sativa TaxID=90675 RepID=A0ABM1Q6W7_CAMSA|nr:PREDICTED: uncharacterized protein LOC104704182 [Camelina sativa]